MPHLNSAKILCGYGEGRVNDESKASPTGGFNHASRDVEWDLVNGLCNPRRL
jgi:hypothetical protein